MLLKQQKKESERTKQKSFIIHSNVIMPEIAEVAREHFLSFQLSPQIYRKESLGFFCIEENGQRKGSQKPTVKNCHTKPSSSGSFGSIPHLCIDTLLLIENSNSDIWPCHAIAYSILP